MSDDDNGKTITINLQFNSRKLEDLGLDSMDADDMASMVQFLLLDGMAEYLSHRHYRGYRHGLDVDIRSYVEERYPDSESYGAEFKADKIETLKTRLRVAIALRSTTISVPDGEE